MTKFALTFSIYFLIFGSLLLKNGLAGNPEERGDLMEGDILGIAPSLLVPKTRSGLLHYYFRWPNAIIPYTVESGYPYDLRIMLQQAMQEISRKTCIVFTPRTSEADYIHIYSGVGCNSYVGRIRGIQQVSLERRCKKIGIFIHELIHVIGFLHEQSRTDRDDYVTIHYANIQNGLENEFTKYEANYISNFGVAYDYDSVMHYDRTAFSKNGMATITPKQRGVVIGQRERMSSGDAAKINNMYCKKQRILDIGSK